MDSFLNWFHVHKDALAGIGSVFGVVGAILAVMIFEAGRRQYKRAENWRRTEFLAKLYKDFSDDNACRRATWMLDGGERIIYFEEGNDQKAFPVNEDVLFKALRDYSSDKKYSDLELHIRESLDRFFVYLEQFDRAIQNNLVEQHEVYPYFGYWIDLLNGAGPMDDKVRRRIRDYINDSGFEDVDRLLRRW